MGGIEIAAPLAIGPRSALWGRARSARWCDGAGWRALGAERAGAPSSAARLSRSLPRLEHEGGPGGWLTGEQGALVEDEEVPIEELADVDATAGIGAPTRARRDLHPARAEAHGVVAGDEARVATAQEAVEVARRRAPGWGGVSGRSRKAARVVGEELGQEGVAGLDGHLLVLYQGTLLASQPSPGPAFVLKPREGPGEARRGGRRPSALSTQRAPTRTVAPSHTARPAPQGATRPDREGGRSLDTPHTAPHPRPARASSARVQSPTHPWKQTFSRRQRALNVAQASGG